MPIAFPPALAYAPSTVSVGALEVSSNKVVKSFCKFFQFFFLIIRTRVFSCSQDWKCRFNETISFSSLIASITGYIVKRTLPGTLLKNLMILLDIPNREKKKIEQRLSEHSQRSSRPLTECLQVCSS